jgi:hypothetical protein
MEVFITWSGDRSRELAEFLKNWLHRVVQSADPWVSTEMGKGVRWNEEVATRLRASTVGIICLDGDNLLAPWVNFEAGAISTPLEPWLAPYSLTFRLVRCRLPWASSSIRSLRRRMCGASSGTSIMPQPGPESVPWRKGPRHDIRQILARGSG